MQDAPCGRSPVAEFLNFSEAPACVGCGWCCLDNPCEESHRRHGYLPRCPDLVWDAEAGRYWCGLMLIHADADTTPSAAAAEVLASAAAKATLYAGEGCCARHNPWRAAVRWRG